jgi:hypothetical protein
MVSQHHGDNRADFRNFLSKICIKSTTFQIFIQLVVVWYFNLPYIGVELVLLVVMQGKSRLARPWD